jgi:hypothetical protein
VETITGEKLLGEIIDSPPKEILRNIPFQMFQDGIWLKRSHHISFIANSDITLKRPANLFDRES